MSGVNQDGCTPVAGLPEEAAARGDGPRGAMRPGAFPLESGAGGGLREWIRCLNEEACDPLSGASRPMRWLYRICRRGNRLDRLVNRLVLMEKAAHAELLRERAATDRGQAAVAALLRDKRFIQRMLDERDRQFAGLQAELAAMRRDRVWRIVRMLRSDVRRIRRLFRAPAGT